MKMKVHDGGGVPSGRHNPPYGRDEVRGRAPETPGSRTKSSMNDIWFAVLSTGRNIVPQGLYGRCSERGHGNG